MIQLEDMDQGCDVNMVRDGWTLMLNGDPAEFAESTWGVRRRQMLKMAAGLGPAQGRKESLPT